MSSGRSPGGGVIRGHKVGMLVKLYQMHGWAAAVLFIFKLFDSLW